jgi:ATP-binding cassette, subfamily B, multidrug efflux pump
MAKSHHEEEALGKANDTRSTARLLGYVWPYRWRALTAFTLTIANAPLVLVGALLTKVAVDLYFTPHPLAPEGGAPTGLALWVRSGAGQLGLGGSAYHGVIFIALIFAVTNFLMLALKYAQDYVLQVMGQRMMFDLRQQVFKHLHRLPIRFFDHTPLGQLMTRLTTDIAALNEVFATGVVSILGNLAVLVFIAGWMFLVNWRLALVSMAILPPLTALTAWFRKGTRSAVGEFQAYVARINSFLQEHLTGMSVVHLFGREETEMDKFRELGEAQRKAGVRAVFYSATFTPAVEVIGATGIALIIWYGGGLVLGGVVTVGTLVAFQQLAKSFYDPIIAISEKYAVLQTALSSSERTFKLLDEPAPAEAPEPPLRLGRAAGRIEFRNVWFAYQGEDWALKDVSFVIEPGERIAFVGHTGAGKTTITNLLLGFYVAQRGQILIDDIDIGRLDLEELRSNFGIVLQDVFLFSGDIMENIRLGASSITDEDVHEAAREVRAEAFIKKLPEGFATTVNERGAGLSVGQKQLISFARALVRDPSVLILDEATSSIDIETEELIGQAVLRVMRGRTSLVIAHRLSTIQTVDKIVVLHQGEVKEVGSHQELLARGGIYWRLYRLQFASEAKQVAAHSYAGGTD